MRSRLLLPVSEREREAKRAPRTVRIALHVLFEPQDVEVDLPTGVHLVRAAQTESV